MVIVAAIDQSERAKSVIERARELADVYGVELHVVHVGSFSVGNLPGGGDRGSADDVQEAREQAREIAAQVTGRVEGHGEFEPVGLIGDPPEELITYSAEHDAEYIVVSGRKQSPLGQALFGSVTQSLLLNADRPVVAIPPDEG